MTSSARSNATSLTRGGRDQVCERTACTANGPADHLGKAHLDPRDRKRFDGNGISLRATTHRVRDELTALEQVKHAHPDLAEIIDVAVHAALAEIHHLADQVVHTRADADRTMQDASRRALDCEDHGKTIQVLEKQLGYADQAHDRAEQARLALLGGVRALDDFAQAANTKTALGQPLPETATVIEAIRGVLKKTHAAHTRVWSRRTPDAP